MYYVGITNDVVKRVYEHKHGLKADYTSRYNISKLLYYEIYNDINEAIAERSS